MRSIAILLCATMVGCSHAPVADLRVSGESAQYFTRDTFECKQLAKQVVPSWTLRYGYVVDECLKGRGHSIINNW